MLSLDRALFKELSINFTKFDYLENYSFIHNYFKIWKNPPMGYAFPDRKWSKLNRKKKQRNIRHFWHTAKLINYFKKSSNGICIAWPKVVKIKSKKKNSATYDIFGTQQSWLTISKNPRMGYALPDRKWSKLNRKKTAQHSTFLAHSKID